MTLDHLVYATPDLDATVAKWSGCSASGPPWADGTPGVAARSTFQCRVNAGPWRSCTAPRTLGTLGLGRHTFAVRARRDGLTDATPAIRRFTVARP